LIGFAGLSHLGIIYSLATAAKGFDVVAFHPSDELVRNLSNGKFPIEEPGLQELFAANRRKITYAAEPGALAGCDLVFVTLDVKTDEDNRSDTGPLRALLDQIGASLKSGSALILLSQVNPGFTRKLRQDWGAATRIGDLLYQVETLIFGRAVERAIRPERFIVGADNPGQPLPDLFRQWHASFGCPVLLMRYESAELAKIAINFFLVSSVSTTNTLAEVCEQVGADWSEIAPALRLDARIGPKAYLSPGLGVAGGNLERDLVTVKRLVEGTPCDTSVIDAWQRNSSCAKGWTLRRLEEAARRRNVPLDGAVVAVWGLAYKENTHSTKNSASLTFIGKIPQARKQAYDPAVIVPLDTFPLFVQRDSAVAACEGADALVIPTPWPEFRQVDLRAVRASMPGRIIIDPFGMVKGPQAVELGFDHYRLGARPLLAKG
jgi:UDPglucose 6-dehydrogenase